MPNLMLRDALIGLLSLLAFCVLVGVPTFCHLHNCPVFPSAAPIQ